MFKSQTQLQVFRRRLKGGAALGIAGPGQGAGRDEGGSGGCGGRRGRREFRGQIGEEGFDPFLFGVRLRGRIDPALGG